MERRKKIEGMGGSQMATKQSASQHGCWVKEKRVVEQMGIINPNNKQ